MNKTEAELDGQWCSENTSTPYERRLGGDRLSAAALWLSMPPASAHDVVVDSNPADGAVVEEFPETLFLNFLENHAKALTQLR